MGQTPITAVKNTCPDHSRPINCLTTPSRGRDSREQHKVTHSDDASQGNGSQHPVSTIIVCVRGLFSFLTGRSRVKMFPFPHEVTSCQTVHRFQRRSPQKKPAI